MKIIGMLVMLNNLLHDLACGLFFGLGIITVIIERLLRKHKVDASFISEFHSVAFKSSIFILIWILIGGFFRAIAFKQFEWYPMAGRGQVGALIIKHIILVSIVSVSLYYFVRLKNKTKEGK